MYKKQILTAALLAISVTLFLFYIDEGYYNFNWMRQAWHWAIFFMYAAFLFIGEMIILFLFFRKPTTGWATFTKYFLGLAAGLGLALLFFMP